MSKINTVPAALLVAALSLSSAANATLIGDQVSCSITPTPAWVCNTPAAVVGAGAEFELEFSSAPTLFGLLVDLGASSIRISSNEDNAFVLGAGEVLTLGSLDLGSGILRIANLSSTGVSVINPGSVTFTSDSVTIDLDNSSIWQVGSFISFDLVSAQVDEPAALSLIGLGLRGLGFSRRKLIS